VHGRMISRLVAIGSDTSDASRRPTASGWAASAGVSCPVVWRERTAEATRPDASRRACKVCGHKIVIQATGGDLQRAVEFVQMPAEPVAQDGPLGDQVAAMIRQQLHLADRAIQPRRGQARLAQAGVRHRHRVDRVGLARLASAAADGRHQVGGHPHHGAPRAQQVTFQPAG